MKNTNFILFMLAAIATCCAGCGRLNDDPSAEPGSSVGGSTAESPISIVCTTNIVKDIVRQIGGNRVVVKAIMDGPGIDPHTYVTTPKDTNALTAADVVVYSGLHLEGQFDQALESLNNRGIPVICVTHDLETSHSERLIQSEDGLADPHVWFDPELWGLCAQHVARELIKHDPAGTETYERNSKAFVQQMSDVLANGRTALEVVPPKRRILVTAHDAFTYFSRAFNFEVEAVQGISTEGEPGLRRINELIDMLTTRKIAAVFTEQSVSDKNINALMEGCRAKGHELKIGGSLFSDTVGAEGTTEATLAGALMYNIREITTALVTEAVVE